MPGEEVLYLTCVPREVVSPSLPPIWDMYDWIARTLCFMLPGLWGGVRSSPMLIVGKANWAWGGKEVFCYPYLLTLADYRDFQFSILFNLIFLIYSLLFFCSSIFCCRFSSLIFYDILSAPWDVFCSPIFWSTVVGDCLFWIVSR